MVGKFRVVYILLYVVFYVKLMKFKNFEDVYVLFKRIVKKLIIMFGKWWKYYYLFIYM